MTDLNKCVWEYHDYDISENYTTSCGKSLVFSEDDLEADGYRFCPFCGRKIKADRLDEMDDYNNDEVMETIAAIKAERRGLRNE